jgi:hypothetical protein
MSARSMHAVGHLPKMLGAARSRFLRGHWRSTKRAPPYPAGLEASEGTMSRLFRP